MNVFNKAFSLIENTIEFKKEFNSGAGHLIGLTKIPNLFIPYNFKNRIDIGIVPTPQQNIYKTITDNDRKAIVIATRFGNVVMFERYSDNKAIIASYLPEEVKRFLLIETSVFLNSEQVSRITGLFEDFLENNNLSKSIELFISDSIGIELSNAIAFPRATSLQIGKQYINRAGNIIKLVGVKKSESDEVFIDSDGNGYWGSDKRYCDFSEMNNNNPIACMLDLIRVI